jgi:hypothetical protein
LALGCSVAEAARRAGVPAGTVRTWLSDGLDERIDAPHVSHRPDEFCPYVRHLSENTYAYLFGLYLGDGHLSNHPRGVYKLRIYQENAARRSIHTPSTGCAYFPSTATVGSTSGLSVLEPWQQWVAIERQPHMLLRGLVHSDGREARCLHRDKVISARSGTRTRTPFRTVDFESTESPIPPSGHKV